MPKWEYAAIVKEKEGAVIKLDNVGVKRFDKWILVKPGNEPHTISTKDAIRRREFIHPTYPWQWPNKWEEVKIWSEDRGIKINDSSPIVLFEATDLLVLVNLAGAEGWEITGGLGLADGEPGLPESKWRIMRREL